MKKKRFSVEQIIGVLKQGQAGVPVAEVIRLAGISGPRFGEGTALKLKMERLQSDTATAGTARRMTQNTLASRTLTASP